MSFYPHKTLKSRCWCSFIFLESLWALWFIGSWERILLLVWMSLLVMLSWSHSAPGQDIGHHHCQHTEIFHHLGAGKYFTVSHPIYRSCCRCVLLAPRRVLAAIYCLLPFYYFLGRYCVPLFTTSNWLKLVVLSCFQNTEDNRSSLIVGRRKWRVKSESIQW